MTRVLNPIVSESYMKGYIRDEGLIKPEGNIELTENAENVDIAQFATATVNVSGGGDDFLKLTVTLKNERSSPCNIRDFFPTQPASSNILFNVPSMPLVTADFFISTMLGQQDILESGEEQVFDFYYAMYTQPPIIGLAFKSAGNINVENVQNLELVSSKDDMQVMKVVNTSVNSTITVICVEE